jgi:hypothetical protein
MPIVRGMGLEYVIAGRRALPPHEGAWVYELQHDEDEDDDEDDDDDDDHEHRDRPDEGQLQACEILPRKNARFFAAVKRIVGFVPAVIITIDPAAWEMSTIAAKVLAEALDGVMYCDGLVDQHGLDYVPAEPAEAVATIDELEARLVAYEDPKPYSTAGRPARRRARPRPTPSILPQPRSAQRTGTGAMFDRARQDAVIAATGGVNRRLMILDQLVQTLRNRTARFQPCVD